MAKKQENEWVRTKKFYPKPQFDVLTFKLFDEVKVVSAEKGIEVLKPAQFIKINKSGYEPQTKEEEDRLLLIAADPNTALIEESQLPPTAASARELAGKLVQKDEALKDMQEQVETYKKIMAANGIPVEV